MRIHPPEAGTEVFTEQEAVETLESFDLAEAAGAYSVEQVKTTAANQWNKPDVPTAGD